MQERGHEGGGGLGGGAAVLGRLVATGAPREGGGCEADGDHGEHEWPANGGGGHGGLHWATGVPVTDKLRLWRGGGKHGT